MQKLTNNQWKNIFLNMKDLTSDEILEFGEWIEILYLDSSENWALGYGYELFEEGFETEKDAMLRLAQLESELL